MCHSLLEGMYVYFLTYLKHLSDETKTLIKQTTCLVQLKYVKPVHNSYEVLAVVNCFIFSHVLGKVIVSIVIVWKLTDISIM